MPGSGRLRQHLPSVLKSFFSARAGQINQHALLPQVRCLAASYHSCCYRLYNMCQIWRRRDSYRKRLQASWWCCCRRKSKSEPGNQTALQLTWLMSSEIWNLYWVNVEKLATFICLCVKFIHTCHIWKSIKSFVGTGIPRPHVIKWSKYQRKARAVCPSVTRPYHMLHVM